MWDSMDPMVANAQHEPHCPWFFGGVTPPTSRQSKCARWLSSGSRVIIIEMKRSEELDKMLSHVDDEGNEVHERELPDGKRYHVVRNYPKKEEFDAWLGDVRDLEYVEDDELLRWVLTYSLH